MAAQRSQARAPHRTWYARCSACTPCGSRDDPRARRAPRAPSQSPAIREGGTPMRTRTWFLPCVLALPMGLAVACAQTDRIPTDNAQSNVLGMPLSAQCAACAQTAMSGACKSELLACANTPGCFDVETCLEACPPNDVKCFGHCAQASLPFDELTSCVFCQACPAECTSDWSCAGGGSSGTTGGSTCSPVGGSCGQNANCCSGLACQNGACVSPTCAPP